MATLKDWFERKDYGVGLALLAKYSKNRFMLQNLSRKQNPAKLEYELKKLLAPGEEVVKVMPEAIVQEIEDAPVLRAAEVPGLFRPGGSLEVDSLSPELKKLWEFNRDSYKEIRALHEKLKLMAKALPEDRAKLTKRIADLDDKIRANWEVINAWDPSNEPEPAKLIEIDHKRINSNRKFLSINLKKIASIKDEAKVVSVRNNIQLRYDELKSAGENISQDTVAELKKAGIEL